MLTFCTAAGAMMSMPAARVVWLKEVLHEGLARTEVRIDCGDCHLDVIARQTYVELAEELEALLTPLNHVFVPAHGTEPLTGRPE